MAKVIIVAGFEGTGKSSAVRNMNPDETYVFNVLGKDLPFKGSRKMYHPDKGNIVASDNYKHVVKGIQAAESRDMKHMIIDDIGYLMTTEFFARSEEKGWTKIMPLYSVMSMVS